MPLIQSRSLLAVLVFVCHSIDLLQTIDFPDNEKNSVQSSGSEGRNLLDLFGVGDKDADPFLARMNGQCLRGELADCFKSQALSALDDIFHDKSYELTKNVRLLDMPQSQLRSLMHEPYEFSDAPRSNEPEWDQLVKFLLRKMEKFMKSKGFLVDLDEDVTENGRYAPRFIDEIADEIDIIEDKKDSLFNRKQLKRIFIPLLIILKLFKLKLLLFLPLILGLASFKKLLGFLALAIPGVIAYFKFCKPNVGYGAPHLGHSNFYGGSPQYSGYPNAYHFRESEPVPLGTDYSNEHVNFGPQSQYVAYNGWGQYRNKNTNDEETTTTKSKSILPDS